MSKHAKLHAPDISCAHCAMTIKRELAPLEGVTTIVVDVPTKTIALDYADDDTLARAKALLEDIGYPVSDG